MRIKKGGTVTNRTIILETNDANESDALQFLFRDRETFVGHIEYESPKIGACLILRKERTL